jgi:hypothetical protein
MELLSNEEALTWARDAGVEVSGEHPAAIGAGEGSRVWRLRVQVPEDATAIAGLAYTIALTGAPGYDEIKFRGALLWLSRWEIWSESIDRIGYALLDGVRRLSGHSVSLDSAPAQVFEPGEFFLSSASLALTMMFQWDARFVGTEASYAAIVSHEGFVDVITWAERDYVELLTRFRPWKPDRLPG